MKTQQPAPQIALNSGIFIPQLGLGVYQMEPRETEKSCLTAIELGYRHIDTASLYGNEREVGLAVKHSGLPREELFITTKLWPSDFLWTESAFNGSLKKLGLDYIDLYLIHWPYPGKGEAWKILENIYQSGKIKAIGVSNYSIHDLEEMKNYAAIVPAVNQIHMHPFRYQPELVEYCLENGITIEAYSPMNRGKKLDHPTLSKLAEKYKKTSAQIMLRWSVQKQAVVIPKSTHPERIKENMEIFDFNIDDEDIISLDRLS